MTPVPITAIVYSPDSPVDQIISAIAAHLHEQGWRLAGLIQVNEPRSDDARCDMTLRELTSGKRLAISERRGRHACGCMLDVAELVRGVALVSTALEQHPDLLIINKFGKIEASGGGFRCVLGDAIERGVPVLIAVPAVNLEIWQTFTCGLATVHWIEDLPTDAATLCNRLGFRQRKSVSLLNGSTSGRYAAVIENSIG
jgi:nucleoside-triphosphatase THEP1